MIGRDAEDELQRTGEFYQRPNRGSAGDVYNFALLEAAVSRVGAHVLPVAAVTADEMTRPAHLAPLGPLSWSRVMVRFGPLETAVAATAPASFHQAQSDSLGRVLRTRPRVVPCSSTRSAAPFCGGIERTTQERKEANSTSRPENRFPVDALLNRDGQRRPVFGLVVRKEGIGLNVCHDLSYSTLVQRRTERKSLLLLTFLHFPSWGWKRA
jgi:hypothetical protein